MVVIENEKSFSIPFSHHDHHFTVFNANPSQTEASEKNTPKERVFQAYLCLRWRGTKVAKPSMVEPPSFFTGRYRALLTVMCHSSSNKKGLLAPLKMSLSRPLGSPGKDVKDGTHWPILSTSRSFCRLRPFSGFW